MSRSSTSILTQRVILSTHVSLLGSQIGDLILIRHPPRLPLGDVLCELFIVDTYWPTSPANLDLLILPPEDWVFYEKIAISDRPAQRLTFGPRGIAQRMPRDRTIDAGATITLCPSNKTIRDSVFGGHCPYERCHYGIVLVDEISFEDLSLGRSSGRVDLTLCPFCMGINMLRHHEELVGDVANASMIQTATEELLRDAAIRTHRQRVNNMRLQMGYQPLPDDPDLYGLGRQTYNGDGADVLVDYMANVALNEMRSPADAGSEPVINLDRSLARTTRRGGPLASSSRGRGRAGRIARGHVQFRRLDRDQHPGSSNTYEVDLGNDEARLAAATIRIQDYHRTLMLPPQQQTLHVGNETPAPAALESTDRAETALQGAVMRAFDATPPVTHGARPGTPMPPDLPERPRDSHSPAICTEPFRWYQLVQERVLNEVCAICLERFDTGLLPITALPCGHFFHEDCVRGRTREQSTVSCPYRCVGLISM